MLLMGIQSRSEKLTENLIDISEKARTVQVRACPPEDPEVEDLDQDLLITFKSGGKTLEVNIGWEETSHSLLRSWPDEGPFFVFELCWAVKGSIGSTAWSMSRGWCELSIFFCLWSMLRLGHRHRAVYTLLIQGPQKGFMPWVCSRAQVPHQGNVEAQVWNLFSL